VALQREPRILQRHAPAVVRDGDPVAATAAHLDAHPPRPGIERVLDQLLDHRGRSPAAI
jgi:hypothetical protein